MKQIFSFIMLAAVAMFAACEPTADEGMVITSGKEYIVESNGGDVYVTYTGVSGVNATVIEGQEFISSVKTPAVGIVVINVKANTTEAARTAIVDIKSTDGDFNQLIILRQKGSNSNIGGNADHTFTAMSMDGYYYGETYGEGTDRYAFFLSDKGLNNGGQAYTNGTYYYIDCFSPATKSTELPLGTYTFDGSNDGSNGGAEYTITNNSQLILTTDNVETSESIKMTDAKMVVLADQIILEATINGEVHKVTFMGDLTLEDVSEENPDNGGGGNDVTGGQDGEAQSTLEGDRHVTFDGEHRAKWGYEGDYWQTGYSNYTIYIMNKSGGYVYGDTLQFDLVCDNKSTDGKFAGKYTISDKPGKMVMVAGFTNKYAQAVGSWFYEYGGGSASGYKNYAMIKSGTAEFIDNGDGTHTVKLDGYDYKGNNITCNWTGVIEKD
ncbi:MAG: hypothetical protein J6U59_01035 [Alistipes sp.]|nr:hypothetical protein [Alistipes sp.]